MRKNIIAFIAIVIVSMSLTACGNNTASATSTTEYSNGSSNSQNQTSNTEKDPMQDPVHQGNANIGGGEGQGATITPTSSCNPEDYWEGDDFFDIASFAEANGSVYTYWCDGEGNPADKNHATACTFYFSNAWRVTIYNDFLTVINNDTMTNYLIVYEKSSNGYISVCKDNSIVCSKDVIQAFNTVVECLKTSSDKDNPFEGSGLPYH